ALLPDAKSYIDVYARSGLTGPRSVFGHCIHLQESEVAELVSSRSVAAFCPTSNLFLGSGLFDEARLAKAGVRIALATDVGGGTSYSMPYTAAEGCKAVPLNHAAHRARWLQGASAQSPVMARPARLLPDDARQRPGAKPGRPHRLDRARQGSRPHRPRSARDAGAGAPDGDRGRRSRGRAIRA